MRIVTISDSPTIFSGLARVHRYVIDGLLEEGHTVVPCGWFAYDNDQLDRLKKKEKVDPVVYESEQGPVRVMHIPKKNGMSDMYAIFEVLDYIKPDAVITIGDHWHFWYMRALKVKLGFSFAWLPYFTVEHDEIEDKWVSLMRYADVVLVPSLFGKTTLESYLDRPIEYLPYGVDEVFKRPSRRERKALRKAKGCSDKIRFITVAQNTFRKNLPALIQAVKLIAHRDPARKMQFHIHTNVDHDDSEAYLYDLKGLVGKFGVADRFSFPEDSRTFSVFNCPSDSYMAKEYGASDWFVLPSTCEGYGLTVCEAMACGVPAIANASSTMPEHLGASEGQRFGLAKRGFLVSNRQEVLPPSRLLNVVRTDALGQSIWEAFQLSKDPKGAEILEGIRTSCEEYGKGRSWSDMKIGICEAVRRVAGKRLVAAEEL